MRSLDGNFDHIDTPGTYQEKHGIVVELVDTPDLGSGIARCESSSLSDSTKQINLIQ